MYLHVGQDFVLNTDSILGVFDLDNTTAAGSKIRYTDEFLRHAQTEGAVVDLSDDLPKSFILTDFPAETVYLTPLSTQAIKNRSGRFSL